MRQDCQSFDKRVAMEPRIHFWTSSLIRTWERVIRPKVPTFLYRFHWLWLIFRNEFKGHTQFYVGFVTIQHMNMNNQIMKRESEHKEQSERDLFTDDANRGVEDVRKRRWGATCIMVAGCNRKFRCVSITTRFCMKRKNNRWLERTERPSIHLTTGVLMQNIPHPVI